MKYIGLPFNCYYTVFIYTLHKKYVFILCIHTFELKFLSFVYIYILLDHKSLEHFFGSTRASKIRIQAFGQLGSVIQLSVIDIGYTNYRYEKYKVDMLGLVFTYPPCKS